MDSREWLITDNHFGMANVNWSETIRRVQGLRKAVSGEREERGERKERKERKEREKRGERKKRGEGGEEEGMPTV